jgi:hypothetical protein
MTHRINGRFILAVAALALATTGLTTPAHATAGPSDVVVISGCADTTPPVDIPSNKGDFAKGLCGNLFTGVPDVCVIAFSDGDIGAPELPQLCDFDFNGSYDNVVCGTGFAAGQAHVNSADESEVVTFSVAFVAGQGVFTGTSPSDGDPGDTWAGVVDIIPTNGGCPVPQFRFTAAIVGVDV